MTALVTCRAPPSIHSSSKSQLEAEKGQDVKMYCRGTGSPKPTVKWTRVVSSYGTLYLRGLSFDC